MQPGEFTYRSADGLDLFYREYRSATSGLDVLCLPGLTRNSADFSTLAATLSTRYRVIAPDLRGRGRSAWDPQWSNYQPMVYVHDILSLLDHLALPRVVVIGTSLGGVLAMVLAASRSDRIAGIVLNDVAPEVSLEGVARIAEYVGRAAPVANWDEAVRQSKANYGSALPGLSEQQWRDFAERSYRQQPDGTIIADYDPNIGTAIRATPPVTADLWPLFRTLASIPMLAFRGANSDIVAPAVFDRMLAEHPTLQRVVVPDRGHAPLLTEPECTLAIEQFLQSIDSASH
ncbi:alpha/beta fold hydrolase [Steroidobacter flavus]|uniref:Alpha/beta fold hydrolase n=1 Tax=Steroidobacter flavus TaxID=1842136 RepID=A0ABV8SY22_9GAMM